MDRSPDGRVAAVLAGYPRSVQPIGEIEPLGGGGGLSGARLWRFRSSRGMLVLRLWPSHGPGPEHLEQVHHWLSLARELDFLPVPIADASGRTLPRVAGESWELSPWMPGSPESSRPPSMGRVRAALSALAAFHVRLEGERRVGVSTGLGRRRDVLAGLIAGGFDVLERAVRASGGTAGPEALRWLGLARIVAPRVLGPLAEASGRPLTLQPCVRDARPEHFLFEGDRVTGLVDFGAMGIESVAGDLARLLGDWLDADPIARADAIDAYARIRPLDPSEAGLIDVFAASLDLLIGEHWIRWHYLEGRRFDDPGAASRGIVKGLARVERLASAVVGTSGTFVFLDGDRA